MIAMLHLNVGEIQQYFKTIEILLYFTYLQTLILLSEIISKQTEVCLNQSNHTQTFISLVGREISEVIVGL
jgi:hypothetical protein